ncbi:MAG: hypothetical protein A3I75_03055 [Deltaproteobacteria bacterium RIFCSPLOWO2_02_FULL_50_16]|nr:MAG: hypothetical protein A3B79_02025 [Deltaproteobacteria bacterium RIFCSPHIGHO2_02_FULL_50_15]OGQ56923.1 MAG: hypothetical protein A3I75_03055 [Deltaproteobacteria bacterium RIFCSPLOWO2_02_FULL_50_16]
MPLSSIPLSSFVEALRESNIDVNLILPTATLESMEETLPVTIAVEQGVSGDGAIEIPIVSVRNGSPEVIGWRHLHADGTLVDRFDNSPSTQLHRQNINPDTARNLVTGAFTADELLLQDRGTVPSLSQEGEVFRINWLLAEYDRIEQDLVFLGCALNIYLSIPVTPSLERDIRRTSGLVEEASNRLQELNTAIDTLPHSLNGQ